MNFQNYSFQPFIMNALDELGFREPTEIQQRIIPIIQSKKSVIGRSQTGSGKSHSFLLPLVNEIDPSRNEVQVVITSPSRELAEQLYQVATQLASHSEEEIRVTNFVGGTDKKRQVAKLESQQPHIVIGTPGRILDLINDQALKVHTTRAFVVDEADMTLDMGFLFEVDQIAGRLPEKLQMLVFSATIPVKLQPFLKKYMANPLTVNLEPQRVIAETIDNYILYTKGKSKIDALMQVLTIGQQYFTLVFANTKQNADQIGYDLRAKGIDCAVLHGDIQARERKRIMRRVHNGEFTVMVATDLAARGIDIEGVSHVINMEIPKETEFFIHRIGRTGRNNHRGTAITLIGPDEEKQLQSIEALGVEFQTVKIVDGGFNVVEERKRVREQTPETKEVDARIRGMVQKAKKNVKPGYKKKLNQKIKRQNQMKNRASQQKRKK